MGKVFSISAETGLSDGTVASVVLYVSEPWVLKGREERRVEVFDTIRLRRAVPANDEGRTKKWVKRGRCGNSRSFFD